MKKLLLVVLVGGAIVGVVVAASAGAKASTPEARMCIKMGEVCASEAGAKDFDQCVDGMKKLRKMSGDHSFERSQKCIEESTTCAAASGCMMGGVGVGALGELMKGFGTAMSK